MLISPPQFSDLDQQILNIPSNIFYVYLEGGKNPSYPG